jgi:hypothetical protein
MTELQSMGLSHIVFSAIMQQSILIHQLGRQLLDEQIQMAHLHQEKLLILEFMGKLLQMEMEKLHLQIK